PPLHPVRPHRQVAGRAGDGAGPRPGHGGARGLRVLAVRLTKRPPNTERRQRSSQDNEVRRQRSSQTTKSEEGGHPMARLIIKNANLLDGEQAAAPGSTVVVDGDRITEVRRGPGGASTAGDRAGGGDDRTVDLGGRTLMPGMTIGHFHGAYVEVGSSIAPFGLENPPAYSAIVSVRNLEIALACGFTNAVGAGSPCFIDPSLARAVEEGMINGPYTVPCSRELSTTGHSNDWAPWQWEVQAIGVARLCASAEGYRLA